MDVAIWPARGTDHLGTTGGAAPGDRHLSSRQSGPTLYECARSVASWFGLLLVRGLALLTSVGGGAQDRTMFRSSRIVRRRALVVMLGVVLVFAAAVPADASHYVIMMPVPANPYCSLDDACRADNHDHYVYIGYLGPTFRQGVTSTLNGSYDTTDLDVHYVGSPTASTDVIYHYLDLPGTTSGLYQCRDPRGYDCGRADVYFDSEQVCDPYCSDNDVRAVACHETGHSVGLVHGDEAYDHPISNTTGSLYCMQTDTGGLPVPYQLGSHNADQINVVY